ncbi:MAG: cbb3-type cytochrome oxidase assembly protein CcoS, partial [Pseudomonadales bacterium]|nr:cbb3-type cytochrome oxidase assembly protein CcoS [Pseudomonadales bacterium]
MELFLVLIPVTVALVALSLWAFVWSARHEQFDDLDRQAYSILFDEDE